MNKSSAAIVVGLVIAIGGVLLARSHRIRPVPDRETPARPLPRLVDLGAGKCIPCKAMTPVLDELRHECAGKLDVVFIDVWEHAQAAEPYGINLIPTQIFFDASGQELWRHEGFLAKSEILAKWKELGFNF